MSWIKQRLLRGGHQISMDHFDGRIVIDGHAGGIAASGLGPVH